ncbi:MAG: metal-sensitive transcriptional regulator [Candidatus Microsaccharimonas sp.]
MNSTDIPKAQIIKRLNRAEGQVRGIARMVSEDQQCIDVLTQINATRAALDKVAIELVREYAQQCFTNEALTEKQMKQKSTELVGAMSRLFSR